jgi:hypothetical protein
MFRPPQEGASALASPARRLARNRVAQTSERGVEWITGQIVGAGLSAIEGVVTPSIPRSYLGVVGVNPITAGFPQGGHTVHTSFHYSMKKIIKRRNHYNHLPLLRNLPLQV